MSIAYVRPPIQRHSLIPDIGLQIGTRGDRWEEEFIKNIDFSTMDDADDWSYLFRNSKANDFDLSAVDSTEVTNMDYMFQNTHAGTLRLAGLTIGEETSASYIFSGEFDAIDFTGAVFYSLPTDMLNGAIVHNGIQLRTLDVSHLTSLANMFSHAELASLDLTGFNTSTITDMSGMFSYANIPILTGLNTLDFSNVTTTLNMFYYANIPNINLSGVRFNSLINAQDMFYDASYELSRQNTLVTINMSNTYFPALERSYEMFYLYTYNNFPTNLIIDGMTIISNGLYAYQMFAYLKLPEGVGLDLSGFDDCKLSYAGYMFSSTVLGEIDFTHLDFSELTGGLWDAVFRECKTPIIHVQTALPYMITSYTGSFFLTFGNFADEFILEIIMPSGVSQLSNVVYPQYSDQRTSYLIKDSTLYASSIQNFISNSSNSFLEVTFENTVLHVGDNGSLYYALYDYASTNDSFIDMRDLVIDGTITNMNYLTGYGSATKRIYFPDTGIKIGGTMSYFIYGKSFWDSTTQQNYYQSPVLYNLDRFDTSRVTSMSYLFYYCNGDYDISSWNVGSLQNISYLLNNCIGNYDLSGWDTSHVTTINGIGSVTDSRVDLSGWDLSSLTSLYGISIYGECVIDFDGWNIPIDRNISNCYLIGYSNSDAAHSSIYVPNTLFQPTSYQYNMFGGSSYNAQWVIDLYTNATDVERQNWSFIHIYSESEPWGYRIHLNTTHEQFLSIVNGGD